MLDNQQFLNNILLSFREFVNGGTSRSNAKLKPLHRAIAEDVAERLGDEFELHAQGYGDQREKKLRGRYYEKSVDIAICEKMTGEDIAGIGVKYVMQNCLQNSNNYFENMLGETANIRAANCPYFQIFIIMDELPYYDSAGKIAKWETFTPHNMEKYLALAKDDIDAFKHTPNKTLVQVVHISPEASASVTDKKEYMAFYKEKSGQMSIRNTANEYRPFGRRDTVIFNDYERFMEKVFYTIKATV